MGADPVVIARNKFCPFFGRSCAGIKCVSYDTKNNSCYLVEAAKSISLIAKKIK